MTRSQWLSTEIGCGRVGERRPYLLNDAGSWEHRPDAATAIPNLFLAADYVRTYSNIDFTSMETANEVGRRAANALLKAAGSTAGPVRQDVPAATARLGKVASQGFRESLAGGGGLQGCDGRRQGFCGSRQVSGCWWPVGSAGPGPIQGRGRESLSGGDGRR